MNTTELLSAILQRAQNPETIHDMAEGLSPEPKIERKLSEAEWDKLQARIDFPLPALLKTIYTEIGNGGFGPGYGLDTLHQIIQNYQDNREIDPSWQAGMLPLCTWGCAIYSCVDCVAENQPVYICELGNHVLDDDLTFEIQDAEGNVRESGEVKGEKRERAPVHFILHRPSLADWLEAWVTDADLWTEMVSDDDDDDWEEDDEEEKG